jgi:Pro-kumamolisin, activation domain/Bacterial Ig-like domain (group 3)
MQTQPSRLRTSIVCLAIILAVGVFASFAGAQSEPTPQATPARIVLPVDNANRTVLTGNTYYLAQARFETGAAPASLPMQRMLMLLRRSLAQESTLEQFMQDQQNSASPNYHNWLTPQQFGAQFGPAPQDIQTVVSWLRSQGFTVNRVSNGATVIEFSGTAGQVQSAFHTTIHKYNLNGAEHWANSSDPSIPAALAPVVVGLDTLHNFPRKPMHVVSGVFTKNRATRVVKRISLAKPLFNVNCGTDNNGNPITCFPLGPYDFGTIYNVLPLWSATPAIDGTGQTIAIIGESDVDKNDIESFQALFGLPTKDPQIVLDGPDPGVSPGDETESDLDLEWSGAVAKGATIKFVIAATTNTTLGVDLAAQSAVDQNIAPIMSESYGICEAGLGTAGNQFFNSLWQQAAAQGITVILAAGDSGSAGCDSQDNAPPAPAEFGLQVSGFASTPYNVAVGGTDFNDIAAPFTFWNATSAPTTQESAKGYIPEVPWNDTCTSSALSFFGFPGTALANCNNPQLLDIAVNTLGGSGGKSGCTIGDGQDIISCSGGYAKPAWQTGKGVPADGKRDIPDVSLYAATGFYSGSSYIVCAADQTDGVSCDADNLEFLGVGGTSASAPSFAGIMAMVVQKTAARQGNANYTLYNLAAQPGASCTSAASPASSCVFYDVTTGTNAMACDDIPQDSPVDCGTAGAEQLGILTGYNAGSGYDLATGLGSVNAANLVKNWATFSSGLKSSATTLTLSPATGIVHGSPVNVTIGVSALAPATGTPTGNVALEAPTSIDPGVAAFALTTGAVSSTTDVLPGGSYNIIAHYPGDSTFSASNSAPVAVTVTPEASKVAVSVVTIDATGFPEPFSSGVYGSAVFPRVDVTGASGNGFPSGNVTLKDNNQAINGGLTLPLNSQGNALPTNPIFTFNAGSHSLTAAYPGDASFKAGTSAAAATFTIQQVPTAIIAGTPGTIQLGFATTISATLSGSSCGNPPTGTITFFDGVTQLGTPQQIPGGVAAPDCVVGSNASVNTNAFTQGANSITAKYSGDTNYVGATSPAQTLDAQALTTSTLSESPATIQQGQSVTLTVSIKSSQTGGPSPTGTVSFSLVGQTSNSLLGMANVSNGQAQFSTTALPAGSDPIFANYSGDSNYTQSTASNILVQVTPGPDFSLTFAPAAIVVTSQGATGTATVTVNGTNGFNTPINFAAVTCTGLPSESTCSFSPASVPVGGTATLTISTTAPSFVTPNQRPQAGPVSRIPISLRNAATAIHPASLVMLFLFCLLLTTQMRRRHLRWFAPALLTALLVITAACGGGGGGGVTPPSNPGTPKVQGQVVTVNVSSGTITHTFTFTLTVN